MADINQVVDQLYHVSKHVTDHLGFQAVVIVIAPDGAFQIRGGPLDTNVIVGVLTRAATHLTMGFPGPAPAAVQVVDGELVS
jgi:hypothetical protein